MQETMSDFAVKLTRVCKKYRLRHEKPTLVENIFKKNYTNEFTALDNINLTIKKGERLGVIGPNGSGKTTLLKIITGITAATSGEVETQGRIVSLIDLEAGFHPELTGEENIFLNAMLLGMGKEETEKKFAKIVKFADIGQFIDAPLYTYSAGMKLRLGFSIAVHTNPDILILDEIMSVGDQAFREKSYKKIQDFFKLGKTIILASHNLEAIKKNCRRVLWLEEGKIKN